MLMNLRLSEFFYKIALCLIVSLFTYPLNLNSQDLKGGDFVVISTSCGDISLQLDREKSPLSVENFLRYVHEGFYKDLIFHRVIKGFMIQGGGLDLDGREKISSHMAISNESKNALSNKRGTVAMARTNHPHSATSQFFINTVDNTFLDAGDTYGYAVFGRVIEGMEVVDEIEDLATDSNDRPLNPPRILKVKYK